MNEMKGDKDRLMRNLSIEVLHGSHVAWQEQKISFPVGKEVLSDAKYFHCSCHGTWLPCKTSIHIQMELSRVFRPVHVNSRTVSCLFLQTSKRLFREETAENFVSRVSRIRISSVFIHACVVDRVEVSSEDVVIRS